MYGWFKKFFTDETFFERSMRSLIVLASFVLPTITGLPTWVTGLGTALAVFIGAGQKNNDPKYPVHEDNVVA